MRTSNMTAMVAFEGIVNGILRIRLSTSKDKIYRDNWNRQTRLYEGIPELLDNLAKKQFPSAFLFVGDSAVDIKTADAAGMHSVGAGWGFRGPKELEEAGCRTLVQHPLDILSLL